MCFAWTYGVGLAMWTAGEYAQVVGNYGVAVANICKTAIYAAQGNLMGALTSVATAAVAVVAAKASMGNANTGLEAIKAGVTQEVLKTGMNTIGTTLVKATLHDMGETLLLNANNIINTASSLFGGSDDNSKKKKSNYKMSNKVKKIMRKNSKRRKSINKKYG